MKREVRYLGAVAPGTWIWLVLLLGLTVRTSAVPDSGRGSFDPKGTIPTVGMEGRLEVTLPGGVLEARPVDEKSLVILRIADTRPHGTLTWYDLRYMGLVPGSYDLREYLGRKDGSAAGDLPALPVTIKSVLPAVHTGELIEQPRGFLGFFGGYRKAILFLGSLWILGTVWLWFNARTRVRAPATAVTDAPPTLEERLRPFIEQAAAGELTTEGKAQLERILLACWRERLHLGEASQAEAIAVLRQHPEAGVLLRALEDWLHRPPGAASVDVNELLAPYRARMESSPLDEPTRRQGA